MAKNRYRTDHASKPISRIAFKLTRLIDQRHQQHHSYLRELSERHLPGRIRNADIIQVSVREREVERQRNTCQHGGNHKDQKRALLQHHERVKTQNGPHRSRLSLSRRRCVREGQAEQAHNDRAPGRQQKWCRRLLHCHEPDNEADHDPADRSKNANERKLSRHIRDIPQRE